ncbi:hypothetical protein [Mucilaginibacter ginsenosidivorax]|uniref:Uncharacterized protein n=1 Tax=Mucilaginibacter ginsenosidivorax TaxID=862126 RepID=A0A5B8W5T7_9SPHI|nr:hypothetical protein [Mucilaginibacter ginsenosidivorax]QEC78272.1 hypothetical protein FSB76_20865 [Mucilaginibacter ginsenosidivorax]
MTLPKKGLRNITVDNIKYAWSTTGTDDAISLSIIPMKQQNRVITAYFEYHSKVTHEWILPDGGKGQGAKQKIVITGYIVRQVILHAIAKGWEATGNIPVFNLGWMDNDVDLKIE